MKPSVIDAAMRREDARTTREWDDLMRSVSDAPDFGTRCEGLAERQGLRLAALLDGLGVKFVEKAKP